MSDVAWKEEFVVDPLIWREMIYSDTLENGKRTIQICEVIYGTKGATRK